VDSGQPWLELAAQLQAHHVHLSGMFSLSLIFHVRMAFLYSGIVFSPVA
jgi:hypothetical protein